MAIKIAEVFHRRLVNRDDLQGDGKNTAVEFRDKFLKDLDNKDWWDDSSKTIEIDFDGVETLGPSWANEAFAYFTKFNVKPAKFFTKVIFKNISAVKKATVRTEIETGYNK
ncbi:MAG: STAS-like domain-containing protein [Gammaproteobacteria bacterium]|nr:STAS-like domain-containing protein [Gammaproteobacteria bacterium]